jgi:hypothetical protein
MPNLNPGDPVWKEVYSHFRGLTSPYDDELNFFRNYKAVEALLSGRRWLFSTTDPESMDMLKGHENRDNYAGNFAWHDKARDIVHFGPRSHEVLARSYWEKFLLTKAPI